MKHSTFIELIHISEMLSDKAVVHYLKTFNRNISVSQIIVLNRLGEEGAQMPSQLARVLGYTTGAMTGIANKLVQSGYVRRCTQEGDRRVSKLVITDAGRILLEEAHTHGLKMRETLYSVLTDDELNQYLSIQKKLLHHLMDDDR